MEFRRPRTLAEVVAAAKRDGDVYARLREFLDHFYRHASERREMLREEPPLFEDDVANAYLAATAEHLAIRYRLSIPAWVHDKRRFLHMPHFTGPRGMKAMLLAESPTAFRRRMIFVGYDPLGRPSRRGRQPVPPPWGLRPRSTNAAGE
jgi:hypothetical protein